MEGVTKTVLLPAESNQQQASQQSCHDTTHLRATSTPLLHATCMPACLHACMPRRPLHHPRTPHSLLPHLRASSTCHLPCMPACLHACMPACLHACTPACLHACMPACLHACMPACLHACMPACRSAPSTIRGRPTPYCPTYKPPAPPPACHLHDCMPLRPLRRLRTRKALFS